MPDLQSELRKVTGMTKYSTQLKLVWEYIRDNPGCTNKKVQSHFKTVMTVIASSRATYDLLSRDMIYAEKRKVPRAPRQVNHYFVNRRLSDGYEEWPRPPKKKAVPPVLQALAVVQPAEPRPVPEQVQPPRIGEVVNLLVDADLTLLVDHLPLRFAKRLHGKLNEVFKD